MNTSIPTKTFHELRQWLLERQEVALLDVRDEDRFAQAHPLFAANLPLARLALEAWRRIPRLATEIVLYDDGEGLAASAARTLRQQGYSRVSLLAGGLQGWREAGGELFIDVNVPSKAFGELVESQRHTPALSAQEVQALLQQKANVVVLDARRFDEYQTMNIPGSISVPGAELALRARSLAPDPATRIIVNCAGRTRSIIGAQSLLNAGIPNPVAALRNGTIGWTLEGQALERGARRRFAAVAPEQCAPAALGARAVADRAGVQRAQGVDLARFVAESERSTYLLDVRTPEEFLAGHLPGFRSAPGGQLVQETDVTAPVRGARMLLADDDGVRANMSASWLAQMGWEVWVLDDVSGAQALLRGLEPAPWIAVEPTLSDEQAAWAATPGRRYRRPYEGTDNPREAMQAYLDWEYGLVAQLARDGTHGFWVL